MIGFMPIIKPRCLASLLLALSLIFAAQVKADDHGHEAHHHGHEGETVEIGLSNALVYTLGEGHVAYGLHVHGIYSFGEVPLGLGLGYELVVGEHQHHTLGCMFCYRPMGPLNLCVAPGITFEGTEVLFGAHVEATYEFDLLGFHVGPTVGFAYNSDDMHLSLGLHTGVGF